MNTTVKILLTSLLVDAVLASSIATAWATEDHDTTAYWEKEHALYTHDLNMSNLEQDTTALSTRQYILAEYLLDAKLNLQYTQTDLTTLNNTDKAAHDLSSVMDSLEKAMTLASPMQKKRIINIGHLLLDIDVTELAANTPHHHNNGTLCEYSTG